MELRIMSQIQIDSDTINKLAKIEMQQKDRDFAIENTRDLQEKLTKTSSPTVEQLEFNSKL